MARDTDPHFLMVLLDDGKCLHTWRDTACSVTPQPGDPVPVPEDTPDSFNAAFEPFASVENVFYPEDLPGAVREALPHPPAEGCRRIVTLSATNRTASPDGFESLGLFEPSDAKQLLRVLEENDVPFEVEANHAALKQPGREVSMYLGMYPTGSQMEIFVPAAHLDYGLKLMRWLYPPEKAPPPGRSKSDPPAPPAKPALEVYAPPAADVSWDRRRDFYSEPDSGESGDSSKPPLPPAPPH